MSDSINNNEIEKILLQRGLYKYRNYAKEQLEKGKEINNIIDEIYNFEKSQVKQELGILPQETLPKNIYPNKGVRIGVTKKPTQGQMDIEAEKEGELGFSCHNGYDPFREGNKLSCRLKTFKIKDKNERES